MSGSQMWISEEEVDGKQLRSLAGEWHDRQSGTRGMKVAVRVMGLAMAECGEIEKKPEKMHWIVFCGRLPRVFFCVFSM